MNIQVRNLFPIVIAYFHEFELTAAGGLPQSTRFRPLTPTAMIDSYLRLLIP